jgi:hypothetical protein
MFKGVKQIPNVSKESLIPNMCQHYTNLQPMWGPENMAKGADYDPETFTHKWEGKDIGWVKI